jgi:hypothetical protein
MIAVQSCLEISSNLELVVTAGMARSDLEVAREMLEQKIKYLQVIVAILLATVAGLSVGLGAGLAGATVTIALSSAVAVAFGVITASIAILTFMRR